MEHRYITCDRCKKPIARRLRRFGDVYSNILIEYDDPVGVDLDSEYYKLKKAIENEEKFYTVLVSIKHFTKSKNYDLCYECKRKLMLFLKEGD